MTSILFNDDRRGKVIMQLLYPIKIYIFILNFLKCIKEGFLYIVLGMLFINPAQAAFVSLDHDKFGADSLISDTSTHLKWLNIQAAAGESYNSVISQMQAGSKYEGFRYATTTEVFQLLENFGFNTNLYEQSPNNWIQSPLAENFLPAQNLFSLFGDLPTQMPLTVLNGVTADSLAGGHQSVRVVSCDITANPTCTGGVSIGSVSTAYFDDMAYGNNLSHWLIWEGLAAPLPEPGVFSMLLIGVGLLFMHRARCVVFMN